MQKRLNSLNSLEERTGLHGTTKTAKIKAILRLQHNAVLSVCDLWALGGT